MNNLFKEIINQYVPLIAGGVGAGFVKNLSSKVTSNDKLQAAAPLIGGIILCRMKSPMAKFAGYGMIATGGKELAATFIPQIKGIENMDLGDLFNSSNTINEEVIFKKTRMNNGTVNGNRNDDDMMDDLDD